MKIEKLSDNARELYKIMKNKKFTRKKIAELIGVHVSTVDAWLAPIDAARHRNMSSRMLILLKFKLNNGVYNE
jgi:transcriptional regulator with XRE-family HTH domain